MSELIVITIIEFVIYAFSVCAAYIYGIADERKRILRIIIKRDQTRVTRKIELPKVKIYEN